MAGEHTDPEEQEYQDEKMIRRARELTTRDSVMTEIAKDAGKHLQEHRSTTGFDGLHESMLGQMRRFAMRQAVLERYADVLAGLNVPRGRRTSMWLDLQSISCPQACPKTPR